MPALDKVAAAMTKAGVSYTRLLKDTAPMTIGGALGGLAGGAGAMAAGLRDPLAVGGMVGGGVALGSGIGANILLRRLKRNSHRQLAQLRALPPEALSPQDQRNLDALTAMEGEFGKQAQAYEPSPEFLEKFGRRLIKWAQSEILTEEAPAAVPVKRKGLAGGPPPPEVRTQASGHPDYSRSLVRQQQVDPMRAALLRALILAPVGAATAGSASAMLGGGVTTTSIAAALGALGLGVPAYYSGKGEAESENSRVLAKRRFGIDTPAEQEFMARYQLPGASLVNNGRRL